MLRCLNGIIWLREIVDKLAFKHSVETNEVEEVLTNNPKVRFVEKGQRKSEDLYIARANGCWKIFVCGIHLR